MTPSSRYSLSRGECAGKGSRSINVHLLPLILTPTAEVTLLSDGQNCLVQWWTLFHKEWMNSRCFKVFVPEGCAVSAVEPRP